MNKQWRKNFLDHSAIHLFNGLNEERYIFMDLGIDKINPFRARLWRFMVSIISKKRSDRMQHDRVGH